MFNVVDIKYTAGYFSGKEMTQLGQNNAKCLLISQIEKNLIRRVNKQRKGIGINNM